MLFEPIFLTLYTLKPPWELVFLSFRKRINEEVCTGVVSKTPPEIAADRRGFPPAFL